MEGKERLVRFYGAREVWAGLMSLSPDKHAGLCSRVAGDGLDIATLLIGLRANNPKRGNVTVALAAVGAITLFDLLGVQATSVQHGRNRGARLYRERSGFPRGVQAAKGAAKDFVSQRETRSGQVLAFG